MGIILSQCQDSYTPISITHIKIYTQYSWLRITWLLYGFCFDQKNRQPRMIRMICVMFFFIRRLVVLYESARRVYWVPQVQLDGKKLDDGWLRDGFGWSETYRSLLRVHARDEILPLPLFSATQKKVIRLVSLIQTLPCFFGLQIVGGRFTQLLASSVTLFVWKSCSSHFRFCEFWGKSSFYYPPKTNIAMPNHNFSVGYYTSSNVCFSIVMLAFGV